MIKSENAIEVKNLSKSFRVYYDKGSQLKEKILFKNRNKYEKRQVLNDISFEIKKGEAVGLIGHNGCGKSTTLKLLTRIIYPDSGYIEMSGRVSSLIELGAGFHPDMSGRENIYTNAAIFGLSKKEIDSRVDQIIEFSELEEFIDNPVRTYSSGMYMRLAFSVAINVDADILLIDEILAVGDVIFQSKCFNKLREIKANGTTIVIVSHSLGQIEQICDRSIWIHRGKIEAEGKVRDVHPLYMEYMAQKQKRLSNQGKQCKEEMDVQKQQEETSEDEKKASNSGEPSAMRFGNGDVIIKKIYLEDANGQKSTCLRQEENFNVVVEYEMINEIKNPIIGISIYREDGILCYGTHTQIDGVSNVQMFKQGIIKVCFTNVEMIAGMYSIDFAITSNMAPVDYYKRAVEFEVAPITAETGVCVMKHNWGFENAQKNVQ